MENICKKCGALNSSPYPIFRCENCGHVHKPISYKKAYYLLLKRYHVLEKDFVKVYGDLKSSEDANFNITLSFIITSLILLVGIIVLAFIKVR